MGCATSKGVHAELQALDNHPLGDSMHRLRSSSSSFLGRRRSASRRDEADGRTDSSTSVSTQQSDRSSRPPLPPRQQGPPPAHVATYGRVAASDAQNDPAGRRQHSLSAADGDQLLQQPPSDPAYEPSVDGGRQRRRRLTAAGQAEAAEADGQDEAIAGPRPYARMGPAAPGSPVRLHRQQQAADAHQHAGNGNHSPGAVAQFQRRSFGASPPHGSAALETATSGDDVAAAPLLADGSHATAQAERQRRFDSQSTSALEAAAAAGQPAHFAVGREPVAEAQQPKKRLGRRLTTQSLDTPLSRMSADSGPAFGHSTPGDGSPSAGRRMALRQSMPGGFAQPDDRQAGGSSNSRMRLDPGAERSGVDRGDNAIPLATRSVDSRAGGGGSVFAQQLASLRASNPASLQTADGRLQQQQPAGPLKRHATAGNWVSALVPPAPAGSAEPSFRTNHRWSEGAQHGRHTPRQQPQQQQQEEDAEVPIAFGDLEGHRLVGTGQFGLVRLVRHLPTGRLYALKVLHKAPIKEAKQVEHVINERRTQAAAHHPLCVRLHAAFQDVHSLYLLQEFVPGGELLARLDLEGRLQDEDARWCTACVIAALAHLHAQGIVYRDLKPENLLVDAAGYIKVADFGFAKQIGGERTYTICGTPDYQAPEVIQRRGTSFTADWWGIGVLLYELLVGEPPFKSASGDTWDTFRRILAAKFVLPDTVSPEAGDLVDASKRLGCGPRGAQAIRDHPYFAGLDWAALGAGTLRAPFRSPAPADPLSATAAATAASEFGDGDGPSEKPPPFPGNQKDPNHGAWADLWSWVEAPLRQAPPPPRQPEPAAAAAAADTLHPHRRPEVDLRQEDAAYAIGGETAAAIAAPPAGAATSALDQLRSIASRAGDGPQPQPQLANGRQGSGSLDAPGERPPTRQSSTDGGRQPAVPPLLPTHDQQRAPQAASATEDGPDPAAEAAVSPRTRKRRLGLPRRSDSSAQRSSSSEHLALQLPGDAAADGRPLQGLADAGARHGDAELGTPEPSPRDDKSRGSFRRFLRPKASPRGGAPSPSGAPCSSPEQQQQQWQQQQALSLPQQQPQRLGTPRQDVAAEAEAMPSARQASPAPEEQGRSRGGLRRLLRITTGSAPTATASSPAEPEEVAPLPTTAAAGAFRSALVPNEAAAAAPGTGPPAAGAMAAEHTAAASQAEAEPCRALSSASGASEPEAWGLQLPAGPSRHAAVTPGASSPSHMRRSAGQPAAPDTDSEAASEADAEADGEVPPPSLRSSSEDSGALLWAAAAAADAAASGREPQLTPRPNRTAGGGIVRGAAAGSPARQALRTSSAESTDSSQLGPLRMRYSGPIAEAEVAEAEAAADLADPAAEQAAERAAEEIAAHAAAPTDAQAAQPRGSLAREPSSALRQRVQQLQGGAVPAAMSPIEHPLPSPPPAAALPPLQHAPSPVQEIWEQVRQEAVSRSSSLGLIVQPALATAEAADSPAAAEDVAAAGAQVLAAPCQTAAASPAVSAEGAPSMAAPGTAQAVAPAPDPEVGPAAEAAVPQPAAGRHRRWTRAREPGQGPASPEQPASPSGAAAAAPAAAGAAVDGMREDRMQEAAQRALQPEAATSRPEDRLEAMLAQLDMEPPPPVAPALQEPPPFAAQDKQPAAVATPPPPASSEPQPSHAAMHSELDRLRSAAIGRLESSAGPEDAGHLSRGVAEAARRPIEPAAAVVQPAAAQRQPQQPQQDVQQQPQLERQAQAQSEQPEQQAGPGPEGRQPPQQQAQLPEQQAQSEQPEQPAPALPEGLTEEEAAALAAFGFRPAGATDPADAAAGPSPAATPAGETASGVGGGVTTPPASRSPAGSPPATPSPGGAHPAAGQPDPGSPPVRSPAESPAPGSPATPPRAGSHSHSPGSSCRSSAAAAVSAELPPSPLRTPSAAAQWSLSLPSPAASPRRPEAIDRLRASAARVAAGGATGSAAGSGSASPGSDSSPAVAAPAAPTGVLQSPLAGSMVAFATGRAPPGPVRTAVMPGGLRLRKLRTGDGPDATSPLGSATASPVSHRVSGDFGTPPAGDAGLQDSPRASPYGASSPVRRPAKRQLSLARGAPLL